MTSIPWTERALRWGQTNITEIDPTRYDIAWWREHWRRTCVQGVIINAAGIVAYYPSAYPLTYYAEFLNGRDLLGELVEAARQEGLAVLARMDSNRVAYPFYVEHPDWMAVDAQGQPMRAGDRYVTCVHGPYYQEYLPEILREVALRYQPDGFTDNSWSGPDRDHISYSPYARQAFQRETGLALPRAVNWDDPNYRRWIKWSYARRVAIWELNNRTTHAAGGEHCHWLGMISGEVIRQSAAFRDYAALGERMEAVMLDFQSRRDAEGFYQNGEAGKMIHGLVGWDTLTPESMAMYEHAPGQPFRVSAKSEPEARMWAIDGIAGGIQPWWHHIGAYHEDRRQYRTAEPLWRWHAENEQYLIKRRPVASVGVVWSQDNIDFYGRDQAETRVAQPWQGLTKALVRARIPYLPIHVEHIARDSEALRTLILPNLGALSDEQCQAIRAFVERGGSLIASGETSLYDAWGAPRDDLALGELLGVRWLGASHGSAQPVASGWLDFSMHSYLRLAPSMRARAFGPLAGDEPTATGERHPALAGFDETDVLPFGGLLSLVAPLAGTEVPATFVPPFPAFPPETSWMRYPESDIPALVLRQHPAGGRSAYLAADIDRCFGRAKLPDHARLLANLVRWAAGDSIPLEVQGPGLIDCHLYRQPGRLVLHLVNLSGTEVRPLYEFLPVGPHQVRVRLDDGLVGRTARLLVAGGEVALTVAEGWASLTVPRIVDHEVVVIG